MADSDSSRMNEPSFDGDGIKTLAHIRQSANRLNLELAFHLIDNNGGRREKTHTHLAKDIEERIVFELANDLRTDVIFFKPVIERTSQSRIFAGKKHGSTIQ